MPTRKTALITGFPALRARHILQAVARSEPQTSFVVLVPPERMDDAEQALAQLSAEHVSRVELRRGDPAAMDFGLPGKEYLALARRIDVVHAAYSITDPAASTEACQRANVCGARELVELGRAASPAPTVVFYSTVFVSGNRSGRVPEGDLEAGQSFRSASERTLAIAERMLRRSKLPVSVLRAGHLIGDLETGLVEHLIGPYPLVVLLVSALEERPMPAPPGSDAVLPLTPVDHLAALGAFVAREALHRRTFHVLMDERVSLRRFLELCAERCGRRIEPGFNPTSVTRALLGNPAARLLPQSARGILDVLTTSAEYDTRELTELGRLGAPAGAPLHQYLDSLVRHVQARTQDGNLAPKRPASTAWLVS